MIKEYFKISMKSMKYRKVRSWLTILGIVIGIAAIISLISLGQGLENAIVGQFEKMGMNSIRIIPQGFQGTSAPISFDKKDVNVVEGVVGVDYVEEILIANAEVVYGRGEAYVSITATPVEKAEKTFADVDITFDEGRRYNEDESNVVVIGYNTAHDTFDRDITLKSNIKIEGKKFRVVGIMEKSGAQGMDDRIMMPLDDAREVFDKPEEITAMRVQALPGTDLEKLAEEITRKLKRARDDENFEVFTPKQMLEQLGSILSVVKIVLAGIAAISLLVGGVGIMNSMYTSVKERTRQIGVMKAIGATNSDIVLLFLTEAGLVGLVGGIFGVMLGMIFAYIVEAVAAQLGFTLLEIVIDWTLVLGALAFSFTVGVVSGLLPATKASKMEPVDALRYE